MSLLSHHHLIQNISEQYNIPSQYIPIEYIENTASAFIITNYIPKGTDIRIEGKYLPKSVSGDYCAWFSAYTGESYRAYRILNGNSTTKNTRILGTCGRPASGGNWGINPIVDITTAAGRVPYEFTLDYNTGTVNINGQGFNIINAATGTTSSENTGKLQLFRQASGGYGRGQFFWLKVYKNNVLVLDLIPVRSGSTGYMYDRKNKVLYGNSGSGSFALGPDLYKAKSVPYTYTPIEYLESSTTKQYIDTGINYDFSKNIKIEIGVIPLNSDRTVIIGNYNGSAACLNVELGGTANSHPLQPRYYISLTSTSSTSDVWYNQLEANNKYDFIAEYDITSHPKTFTYKNSPVSVNYSGTVYGTTQNLRLFYDYRSDSNVAHPLRITYCKIYLDDALVRDFIPVKDNNVGYMYDRVTGQYFGNEGGGSFILGPEISATEIEDSGYDEELSAIYLYRGQEVEIGEYVDTVNDKLEIDFMLNHALSSGNMPNQIRIFNTNYTGTQELVFSIYVNGNRQWAFYNGNGGWSAIGNTTDIYQRMRTKFTFDMKNQRIYSNSYTASVSLQNRRTSTTTGRIFSPHSQAVFPEGYVYSFKYWHNNELVRDMIPVLKDGVAYLYDKVHKSLHGVLKSTRTDAPASIPDNFGYAKKDIQQISYVRANNYNSYCPAWLNTEEKVTENTEIEVMGRLLPDITYNSSINNKPTIFGTCTSLSNTEYRNAFLLQYNIQTQSLEMRVASGTEDTIMTFGCYENEFPYEFKITDWHKYRMNANELWIDDMLVLSRETPMGTISSAKYLYLFGSTNTEANNILGSFKGAAEDTHFPGDIAYCKIWQNGVLVKDYSPAVVTRNALVYGSNPEGINTGFYDNINKVFRSSEVGPRVGYTFGPGYDGVEYNYIFSQIPNDYEVLNYIFNSNTQGAMDTGLKFNLRDYAYESKFKQNYITNGMLAGTNTQDINAIWFYNYLATNHNQFAIYGKYSSGWKINSTNLYTPLDTNIHTIRYEGDNGTPKTYHNGIIHSNYDTMELSTESTDNFYVFGRGSTQNNYIGKIYYAKLWDMINNNYKFYYIPVLRKGDEMPGFYDIINREFKTITDAKRKWWTEKTFNSSLFNLIYEWKAEDWTSGVWYDRIANQYMSVSGSPTKGVDDDGDTYLLLDFSNYFYRNQGVNFPMPRNFVFEITCMRTITGTYNSTTLPWYIADWGSLSSVGNAYSGYGFYINNTGTAIGTNSKPSGNTVVGNVSFSGTFNNDEKFTVRIGCRKYSETQDFNWIEINGSIVSAGAVHNKFANLNTCCKYFGRGWIGSSGYHGGTGRIYSVKIYEDLYDATI